MQLLPFILSLAMVVLLAGWMFVSSRVHYLIKIACATVVVVWALILWPLSTELLGYPINDIPPDGSEIVGILFDQPRDHLFLWIITNKGPRGYALPYDETLAKLLQQAQERARQGNGRLIWHIGGDGHGFGFGFGIPGVGNNGHGGGTGIRRDEHLPNVIIDVVPVLPPKGE